MSLRLLLDEDSQAKRLVSVLEQAGHEVFTINEVGLAGSSDDVVFNYANEANLVLLTHNCDDFEELHNIIPNYSGILAVYSNADHFKNMSFKTIVKAISNLESNSIPLTNQFIPWLTDKR